MDFNNSSNIYNLDMDLVNALQEFSKKEAPHLDNFFHYCNAIKEALEMMNVKVDDDNLKYTNTLKKYTDDEFSKKCYDCIKIEGEEKPGIPQNLTKEQEEEYKKTEEVLDEVINEVVE